MLYDEVSGIFVVRTFLLQRVVKVHDSDLSVSKEPGLYGIIQAGFYITLTFHHLTEIAYAIFQTALNSHSYMAPFFSSL